MPRHVVLLSRDASLAVALKALLGDRDQVTEIDSLNGWRALNGSPVDVVVVDLPSAPRGAAVQALERKFTGPMVVLLNPGEELAKSIDQQRCSALHRPFGLSELWTLLAAPPLESTVEVPPEPEPGPPSAQAQERSVPEPAPAVERPGSAAPEPVASRSGGGSSEVAAPWTDRRTPEVPEPAWGWRLRRFQQVPKSSDAGELTEPMPRVNPDDNGAETAEAAEVAEEEVAEVAEVAEEEVEVDVEVEAGVEVAAGAAAAGAPAAEVGGAVGDAEVEGRAVGAVAPAAEAAGAEVEGPAVGAVAGETEVAVPDAAVAGADGTEGLAVEAAGAGAGAGVVAPAVEAKVAAAPAAGTAAADAGGAERATSLMDTVMWHEADEAPQAVANRLAKRLRLDVVALLLDNGRGLLDTAGGVGLTPADRRLEVEYGHDVLHELFRVGVGLIDDTARVRGILDGIPFGDADTLMMVPLAHEGHGFGVVLAGRYRRKSRVGESEFTELEIEALMDFAEDVAPALRSAILLRRLRGQLNLAQGL